MPIRNPFARRPGAALIPDENQRPGSAAGSPDAAHPGFERVDTVGSKASSAFSIGSRKSQDTGEYKMSGMSRPEFRSPSESVGNPSLQERHFQLSASCAHNWCLAVVNDSGVYLPVCNCPIRIGFMPKSMKWQYRCMSNSNHFIAIPCRKGSNMAQAVLGTHLERRQEQPERQ